MGLGFVSETSTNQSGSAISTYSEGSGAEIFKNTGSSFGTGLQLGFIFPKADQHQAGVSTENSALSAGMFLSRSFRQSVSAFDSNSMFSSSHRVKI
jgi:hypothetical protein